MSANKIIERLKNRREKAVKAISGLKKPSTPTVADLINAESSLGGTMFGPLSEGHRREFFNASPKVWIWHESWDTVGAKDKQEFTIRYEVHPSGVYKKLDGGNKYTKLENEELENFHNAAKTYLSLIKTHLYA